MKVYVLLQNGMQNITVLIINILCESAVENYLSFRLLKYYYLVNYLIGCFYLLESQCAIRIKPLIALIMIPKEKELKLIKIYMYICDVYESSLRFYCQRSVITIIQSLSIRNCLLYICSAELISNTLKSKTYILLPRNTCFHGSLICLLTKHSIID